LWSGIFYLISAEQRGRKKDLVVKEAGRKFFRDEKSISIVATPS
jgi:hypothetical protein